jgi:phosphate transport system substrate-binding protein
MRRRSIAAVAAVVVLAVVGAACSSGGGGGSSNGSACSGAPLTAAGSTFVQPVYERWFHDFNGVLSGAQINYQAIGSGGGITDLQSKTVDFADSDAPLQHGDMPGFKGQQVVQVPVVLGAVALAYNVPGLQTGLKLDGPTVADIFLGKISRWNDSAIARLNPGVSLPNLPIQTVHRADESGTTFVFTSWLSQESSGWASKVGADKAVQWPGGTGGNGSSGVAAAIQQTKGAIGYVEYQYAVTTSLGVAAVKGKSSNGFVSPSVDSISAAGGGLTFPITSTTNVLNSTAAGAYPLTSTTYFMAYKDLSSLGKDKAQTIVDLLKWMYTDGQSEVKALNFAPLPSSVTRQAMSSVHDFSYKGDALTPTIN